LTTYLPRLPLKVPTQVVKLGELLTAPLTLIQLA